MSKFWEWLAWKIPKRLVYWAAIRLWAAVEANPEISMARALNMWRASNMPWKG